MMRLLYVLSVIGLLTTWGCASQSTTTASSESANAPPWLCQGVEGNWQCQRSGTLEAAQRRPEIAGNAQPTVTVEPKASTLQLETPATTVADRVDTQLPPATERSALKRQDDLTLWTIQWVALTSAAATQAFATKHFANTDVSYDIEHILVGGRRYHILFSGRYPSKALAAKAAEQTPLDISDAPYLRTMASIAAVTVD